MGKLNIVAVIPVRASDLETTGGMPLVNERSLLAFTIDAARESKLIDRIIVSTDSDEVVRLARHLGVEAPFKRPETLAAEDVPLDHVLKHCVDWLETHENYRADIVVLLEISHPVRESGLVDRVIQTLISEDLDTVFTAYEEHHTFWRTDAFGRLEQADAGDYTTRATRRPIYREVSGLACATRALFVREGRRLGNRVGLVPLRDISALIDTQDESGLLLAEKVLQTRRTGK